MYALVTASTAFVAGSPLVLGPMHRQGSYTTVAQIEVEIMVKDDSVRGIRTLEARIAVG